MGQVWVQGANGVWVPGTPAVRNTSGWVPGRITWRKSNTTTWAQITSNDTTPPAAPTISATNDAVNKRLVITVKAPADTDVKLVRVKLNNTTYPQNTSTTDGAYLGAAWSDIPVTPNQTVTRYYPDTNLIKNVASYKTGSTYYMSAWAQDGNYNWSTSAVTSIKVPIPTTPSTTGGTVTKSAYVTTTDSGSWNNQSSYWRSDNNYVYQGGYDWMGCWFYGTQIQALLAKAKKITNMTVTIQRANTVHGVATGAEVWLGATHLASQPSGAPTIYSPVNVGSLTRGQSATFTVPSQHWPYFISGSNKGLGLHWGTTSFTDPKYMYAYGAGTTSGRIYLEWQE